MIRAYWNKGKRQKRFTVITSLVLIILIFFLRDDYQPALLFLRKYIFIILTGALFLWFARNRQRRTPSAGRKFLIFLGIIAFFASLWFFGWKINLYQYMQTYNVFRDLNRQLLTELPLTRNERIQPYNNIVTMAYESIGETQEVSPPQLVRVDSTNQWTMAVQPAREYTWQRINDNTEEIFAVESTSPFPRFSNENRIPVTFSIGESLAFSRNTYNAVVQRFTVFQLFTLEPSDIFYMKDDNGKWVQVVSLIRWRGFFFPYPAFGGVMVIDAGEHDFKKYLERMTTGMGTYIPPGEIKNHKYLAGQNILAEKISRLQARSLQFLGGFTDPLPWNMKTAIKIPELPADQNQQPFVTDFDFEGIHTRAQNGLYHWFGLEPLAEERTSLVYSVFIPADGTDMLYYYDHSARKEGLAGISAMPLKVVESRKEFDWSVNKAVEFRPFIKYIAGRKRMFVLGTITAVRDSIKQFDGAAPPNLALVDTEYRDVIWLDAKHPSEWTGTILKQLGDTWKASERLTDAQLYPDKKDPDVKATLPVDSTVTNLGIRDTIPIPADTIR